MMMPTEAVQTLIPVEPNTPILTTNKSRTNQGKDASTFCRPFVRIPFTEGHNLLGIRSKDSDLLTRHAPQDLADR